VAVVFDDAARRALRRRPDCKDPLARRRLANLVRPEPERGGVEGSDLDLPRGHDALQLWVPGLVDSAGHRYKGRELRFDSRVAGLRLTMDRDRIALDRDVILERHGRN